MKIKFDIDKQASLISGLEVSESTITLDIPVADIPADIRPLIVQSMDGETLRPASRSGAEHGYKSGCPDGLSPTVLANATVDDALLKLSEFAIRETERLEWYNAAVAEKKAADKTKAEEEARIDAEWISGVVNGTSGEICGRVSHSNQADIVRGTTHRRVSITPELKPLVDAWEAAKTTAAAEKAAVEKKAADRRAELKAAAQVNGQNVHEWDIQEGGSIDISVEGGIPYDSDYRAKNWVATVEFSATSPGNLNRNFWDGKGKARVIPANLQVGDYLEGGSKDKKDRKTSKYVRVLEITDSTITVREAKKPGATQPDIEKEVNRLSASREEVLAIKARHAAEDAGEKIEAPASEPTTPNPLAAYSLEELQAEIDRRSGASA